MIANKPSHLTIYEYSDELYNRFGKTAISKNSIKQTQPRTTRNATASRNTVEQVRRGTTTYIAQQKHNQLQEALKVKLSKLYGKENVFLEENYVDIKVKLKDKILLYEVKSSAYAGNCVREALGQIISYSHRETEFETKKLIVAGQFKPNTDEIEYIKYIKRNLKLNFEYEHIDLD